MHSVCDFLLVNQLKSTLHDSVKKNILKIGMFINQSLINQSSHFANMCGQNYTKSSASIFRE
jgi:hypothetical protein